MFLRGYIRQIQRPISENSILVLFMYASCSNYPCLLVSDCPGTKIVLQYAETVYPFSVALYTSNLMFWLGVAHLLLIFCVTFSFVCLPSSHRVLYWRCLYIIVLHFLFVLFCFFTSYNKWENVHSALNPLKNTSVD